MRVTEKKEKVADISGQIFENSFLSQQLDEQIRCRGLQFLCPLLAFRPTHTNSASHLLPRVFHKAHRHSNTALRKAAANMYATEAQIHTITAIRRVEAKKNILEDLYWQTTGKECMCRRESTQAR